MRIVIQDALFGIVRRLPGIRNNFILPIRSIFQNMTFKRLFAPVFAAAVLAFATPAAIAAPPTQDDQAPDFVGLTLERDPVLLSKYAGKAVVVSYWATWCAYCLKELPILDGIQKAGKGNVQVIAVNTEERDVFRRVARALQTLSIQLAYDPDKKAQAAYGVEGIPHLVVIGRDGKIVSTFRGYSEESLPKIAEAINWATGASR
jgi:thiol-disulfide isomerase/thioredoxin